MCAYAVAGCLAPGPAVRAGNKLFGRDEAMGQPYVGEIRIFAGNFAPAGWMLCEGQLLLISENSALFSLIGTTYGGNGTTTFGLPNLASRVPVHQGTGPGLSTYVIGQSGGVEQVALTTQQIPAHSHTAVTASTGQVGVAANNILANAQSTQTGARIYSSQATNVVMNANTVTSAGGSQPHNNIQPSLALNFIIALFGIYPPQN